MSLRGLFGPEVRARFPGFLSHGLVDGDAVPLGRMSLRSMNFGQHWRTEGVSEIGYSVDVPIGVFFTLVEQPDGLPELVDDMKRFPDPSYSLDVALARHGYPITAAGLLCDPMLMLEVVRFFAHDVLLAWLGDGPPHEEPGFVLNTIELIEVRPDALILEGKGRRAGMPVRYQDV